MLEREKMFKIFQKFPFWEKDRGGDHTPHSPFIDYIIAFMVWIFGGLIVMWFLLKAMPFISTMVENIQA
jgi:hypothetical protein